jgi:hypothetical protein
VSDAANFVSCLDSVMSPTVSLASVHRCCCSSTTASSHSWRLYSYRYRFGVLYESNTSSMLLNSQVNCSLRSKSSASVEASLSGLCLSGIRKTDFYDVVKYLTLELDVV